MAKKKGCDCEPGLPAWMATFSDMMTLLLTFFVLLLSMASLDQQKIKKALGSLRGSLGVLEGGTKTDLSLEEQFPSLEIIKVAPRRLVDKAYQNIRVQVFQKRLQKSVALDRNEDGIFLHLDSSVLFKTGEAETGPDAFAVLHDVVEILKKYDGDIQVEGHTDNIPIHTQRYPSNWELSTARAINILRYFVEQEKMDPKRFSAAGYGDTRPIDSNDTPEGRAKNRRVTLVLLNAVPLNLTNEEKAELMKDAKKQTPERRKIHFSTNLRKELKLRRGDR